MTTKKLAHAFEEALRLGLNPDARERFTKEPTDAN